MLLLNGGLGVLLLRGQQLEVFAAFNYNGVRDLEGDGVLRALFWESLCWGPGGDPKNI